MPLGCSEHPQCDVKQYLKLTTSARVPQMLRCWKAVRLLAVSPFLPCGRQLQDRIHSAEQDIFVGLHNTGNEFCCWNWQSTRLWRKNLNKRCEAILCLWPTILNNTNWMATNFYASKACTLETMFASSCQNSSSANNICHPARQNPLSDRAATERDRSMLRTTEMQSKFSNFLENLVHVVSVLASCDLALSNAWATRHQRWQKSLHKSQEFWAAKRFCATIVVRSWLFFWLSQEIMPVGLGGTPPGFLRDNNADVKRQRVQKCAKKLLFKEHGKNQTRQHKSLMTTEATDIVHSCLVVFWVLQLTWWLICASSLFHNTGHLVTRHHKFTRGQKHPKSPPKICNITWEPPPRHTHYFQERSHISWLQNPLETNTSLWGLQH